MSSVSSDRDRARLEWELQNKEYLGLLMDLQRREPFLQRFTTWGDVLAFMRGGTSRDAGKDEVLRPILAAHAADQDHRWRTILLAFFWPGLRSIQSQKRYWDKNDPDELWQRLFWAFHRSICRVDLARRRDRLAQWIYNATLHHLHDEYRRDWIRGEREPATDLEDLIELAGVVEGIDLETIDLRDAHARKVCRLREHLDAGRITKADFLLLLATRLYGQPIAEFARGAGLKAETVKKRRQRAEAAIRLSDKGLE